MKALAAIDVHPLDETLGRAAGELLAAARRRDVIDAAIVLLAQDADHIVTSDPDDLEPLARTSGRHVTSSMRERLGPKRGVRIQP